jgi:hypothetical protein
MSIWGMDSGAEFLVLQMPSNSVNDRYKMPKKTSGIFIMIMAF